MQSALGCEGTAESEIYPSLLPVKKPACQYPEQGVFCCLVVVNTLCAGYSAIPIFTTMMISTFNMIFTACPIVAYAVLEQDLSKKTVLRNPETYSLTRTATRARFFW
jgi:hypothetical protein